MDSVAQMTCSALNNVNTRPSVVFIDAVNQVRVRACVRAGCVCASVRVCVCVCARVRVGV